MPARTSQAMEPTNTTTTKKRSKSNINNNNNNYSVAQLAENKERGEERMEDSSATMLLALQSSSPRSRSTSPTSSPRSPSSPSSSSELSASGGIEEGGQNEAKCMLVDCALCARGVPMLLVRSPTWASIMRVVFFCLQYDKKDREFFNLKTDIYGFIISHWSKLSLDKKRSDNWHKQIQDMLSHSKNLFESGMEKYKQNGFWRMKQNQDPWTMHKPRSYNWTKRTSRTMDGVDSDYMTVFDVATGAVVQEGDIESPRKRIKGDDDSGDEATKQSLEDEVRALREALADMSESLTMVKEELRKKDKEILEKAYAYQKTLEQLEALKLAHHHTGSIGQSSDSIGMMPHQERDLASPSASQLWPTETYSPRTYRHLYPSTPPLSRPLEPAHFPSPPPVHLGPTFPPSRPHFAPFELPMGALSGRRYSPPSLPFPPSHLSQSSELPTSSPSAYAPFNTVYPSSPLSFPSSHPSPTSTLNPQQPPPYSQVNPSQFKLLNRYPAIQLPLISPFPSPLLPASSPSPRIPSSPLVSSPFPPSTRLPFSSPSSSLPSPLTPLPSPLSPLPSPLSPLPSPLSPLPSPLSPLPSPLSHLPSPLSPLPSPPQFYLILFTNLLSLSAPLPASNYTISRSTPELFSPHHQHPPPRAPP